jgi:hypothetical protein
MGACRKAVLVLGVGDEAVALFYAFIGRPTPLYTRTVKKNLPLLRLHGDVNEPRAHDVGAGAGGSLFDDLNLHELCLLRWLNFFWFTPKLAVLP